MSSSMPLCAVVHERAGGAAELVVECDAGGQGEQALDDARPEAVQGAGAVAFERQEVFDGPEDALDPLADRGKVRSAAGLVLAARTDDQRLAVEHRGSEVATGVALVTDHDHRAGALAAVDELQADVALVALWRGEGDRAWGAVEREQAVQPKAPEESAVAAAVAVVGGIGELAAAHRLDTARALNGRGVDNQQVVVKARTERGELADQRLDDVRQALTALPVAGPLGQPREQVPEALSGDGQEAPVGRDAHHRLRDAERDDLRLGDPSPGVSSPIGQEIVGGAEHRNQQQVEVGEHRGPQGRRRVIGTADFDPLPYVSFAPASTPQAVELLI